MSEIKTSGYKCRTNTRNNVVSLVLVVACKNMEVKVNQGQS